VKRGEGHRRPCKDTTAQHPARTPHINTTHLDGYHAAVGGVLARLIFVVEDLWRRRVLGPLALAHLKKPLFFAAGGCVLLLLLLLRVLAGWPGWS
jgi:hypothetical protein